MNESSGIPVYILWLVAIGSFKGTGRGYNYLIIVKKITTIFSMM